MKGLDDRGKEEAEMEDSEDGEKKGEDDKSFG